MEMMKKGSGGKDLRMNSPAIHHWTMLSSKRFPNQDSLYMRKVIVFAKNVNRGQPVYAETLSYQEKGYLSPSLSKKFDSKRNRGQTISHRILDFQTSL
jgi:hypothetical protein